MALFVMEIGTEEMPARFLPGMEQYLVEFFNKALKENALDFTSASVSSTPRRLLLSIADLAEKQRSFEEVVSGPPMSVAFGRDGQPTPAGLGFARSQGVDLADTFALKTEKGEYLAVKQQRGGGLAKDLLPAVCMAALESVPFPKKMRWADRTFAFGRPIRWIVALLDDQVINFDLSGLAAGRLTQGHRVMGPGPFTVEHASQLESVLDKQGRVCLRASKRRARIVEQGQALAEAANGRPIWKESLLDEVCGLVEYPKVIMGKFEDGFLELPREVLLTSMEKNQKSFGLEDQAGKLKPYFLTALNLESEDEALVRKGWERVLKARLEDARFFWKTDLNKGFEPWLEELEHMVFFGKLGSMGDKSRRLERLAAALARKTAPDMAHDLGRAGRLAKADLASEMVGEFADLQGVMGGIYAEKKQFGQTVSMAIYDHYLPLGPDSPVPGSVAGAILAVADKADTMTGCFGLGLIPSGTADPYALRRSALGICRIIGDHGLAIDLRELFAEALKGYGDQTWTIAPEELLDRLMDFMAQRIKVHYVGQGYDTLLVEAAVEAGLSDLKDLAGRLETLREFSRQPDFAQAVLAFKRAANIIRKQGQEDKEPLTGQYDQTLFQEEAEKNLAARLEELGQTFDRLPMAERYPAWPNLLRELRPAVDQFFDQVMVMAEDPVLRRNRLNLLKALALRLGGLADFSQLQY